MRTQPTAKAGARPRGRLSSLTVGENRPVQPVSTYCKVALVQLGRSEVASLMSCSSQMRHPAQVSACLPSSGPQEICERSSERLRYTEIQRQMRISGIAF